MKYWWILLVILLVAPASADYALQVHALSNNPADGATNYFGQFSSTPGTTANDTSIRIPEAGILNVAEIYDYSGTAGTNQAYSYYVRHNNTTDYLISTLSVATNERVFTNSSLNIVVAEGDFVEIKRVHPTWATNPLTNVVGGYLLVNTTPGADAHSGYAMHYTGYTNNPADSVYNNLTWIGTSTPTTGAYLDQRVPAAGTVTSTWIRDWSATPGTAEAYYYYLNHDETLALVGNLSISANHRPFFNNSVGMPLSINDSLILTRKHPAWATNPVTNIVGGYSYIDTDAVQNAPRGYPLAVEALAYSPTDAQTVYFGNRQIAPSTSAGTNKIYIRQAGTISKAYIYSYSGTAGTSEAWPFYVRVNNSVSYLVGNNSLATNVRVWSNDTMGIPVSVGDYVEIQTDQPTWGTNPATTQYGGYIYLQYYDDIPKPSFNSTTPYGYAPLSVTFTDTSETTPTGWDWYWTCQENGTVVHFNTTQNPVQSFDLGHFDIGLNVTNASGYNTTPGNYLVSVTESGGYSGFTQQDLYLSGEYLHTFIIKDATTAAPIASVILTDQSMQSYTTTNGTGYLTEPAGLFAVSFSSEGYIARTISYISDGDETHTVSLTPSSESTLGQTTWYTPKQVSTKVLYYDPAGVPVPEAQISLAAVGSSLQDNTQLQTIYGIDPEAANQMVNGTLLMSTTTGTDGAAVFTILSSIRYNATVTDPKTGTQYLAVLHPGQDPYTIWIGPKPTDVNATVVNALNQSRLWISQPNASYVTLNMQYRDLTGSTTSVEFIVKTANNLTVIYNQTFPSPGTATILMNHTHKNIRGQGYFWYFNATREV